MIGYDVSTCPNATTEQGRKVLPVPYGSAFMAIDLNRTEENYSGLDMIIGTELVEKDIIDV